MRAVETDACAPDAVAAAYEVVLRAHAARGDAPGVEACLGAIRGSKNVRVGPPGPAPLQCFARRESAVARAFAAAYGRVGGAAAATAVASTPAGAPEPKDVVPFSTVIEAYAGLMASYGLQGRATKVAELAASITVRCSERV
jgi:hypothetical protein